MSNDREGLRDLSLDRPRYVDLWEPVLESLRTAIISGKLQPGTRLIETDLAEKLGVSRGPVREAIIHLEREGLVQSEARRQTRVVGLSASDIHEIYMLRTLLEEFAAPQAVANIQAEQLQKLQNLTDDMVRAIEQRRVADVAAADVEFHRSILEASHLRRTLQMWQSQVALTRILVGLAVGYLEPLREVVSVGHTRIIQALAERNPEQVQQALREHIISGEKLVLMNLFPTNHTKIEDRG